MELTINVDESMFAEVAKNELAALKPEQIQEVLLKGIYEYLKKDDYKIVDSLIFNNPKYYIKEPSEFAKNLIRNADFSEIQSLVDKCIESLKTNASDLLIKILTDALIHGLMNTYTSRGILHETIADYLIQNPDIVKSSINNASF